MNEASFGEGFGQGFDLGDIARGLVAIPGFAHSLRVEGENAANRLGVGIWQVSQHGGAYGFLGQPKPWEPRMRKQVLEKPTRFEPTLPRVSPLPTQRVREVRSLIGDSQFIVRIEDRS